MCKSQERSEGLTVSLLTSFPIFFTIWSTLFETLGLRTEDFHSLTMTSPCALTSHCVPTWAAALRQFQGTPSAQNATENTVQLTVRPDQSSLHSHRLVSQSPPTNCLVSLHIPMPMLSTSNFPWSFRQKRSHSGRGHRACDTTPEVLAVENASVPCNLLQCR